MPMEKNHSKNNKKWILKNPLKHKAHTILNDALKSNKITKPLLCENCKKEKELQAHHEDYNKPLEVVWLCSKCHHELHKLKRIENNLYKPKKIYIKKGYNNKGKSKPYKKPLFYEKAKKLRDEGLSYKEISKKIGISKSQIYKWLNKVNYN